MLNIIQTNSHYLSDIKIKKIIKNDLEENITYEKISFDENIDTLYVINEILTDDIFNNIKIILIKDTSNNFIKNIFENKKNKTLQNIINSKNYLFIIVESIRSKIIIKKINDNNINNYILNKNNTTILKEFVKDYLKINKINHKLNKNEIDNIVKICENNIDLIVEMIDKSTTNKNILDISNNIVQKQVKNIEDNPYIIFDTLENKDLIKIKEIINEYYIKSTNIVGILNLLFINYKDMYKVNLLSKLGINSFLISKELNIHPYRIKKIKNKNNYSKTTLEEILTLIIKSEINIKEGSDPYIILKSLLLKIMHINTK